MGGSASRAPLAVVGLCAAAVALVLELRVSRFSRVALVQQRPVLVDVFPPTPAWGATPSSVGQVGNGETPKKGQDSNVLGGAYQYPDYARRVEKFGQVRLLEQIFPETPKVRLRMSVREYECVLFLTTSHTHIQWGTTPNSIGAVGAGEKPAPGQDINVLGGDYVWPAYVRRGGGYFLLPPPRAYVFRAPSARGTLRPGAIHSRVWPGRGQKLLIPHGADLRMEELPHDAAAKLWGGEYSSVGKFPAGFNGQRSYGGEWNVWALPTEQQIANGAGCDEPCIDGPLASIGEHNVLDGLGNDPDSSVWNPKAGDQPAGTGNSCCGQSALGTAGGFEEPSPAWLSA